jgi:predicted metal-binding membrane protein
VSAEANLERLLRRDRLVVAACLAVTTLVAASYIFSGAGMGMTALEMSVSMRHMGAAATNWTTGYALAMFFMWWVMMIAMMLPSASPVILLSAALNRRSASDVPPYGSAAAFTLGYLLAWALFSIAALVLQYGLERFGMLSMHMESVSTVLTGGMLLAAGAWQLSPLKNACLLHCRSPVQFLTRYRRHGTTGALVMGAHHGLYCLGCCWFLMILLFVGGVMNVYWILGLALFVFVEKVAGAGVLLGRLAGAGLLASGLYVLLL